MDPSLWEVIKREYAKLAELSRIMFERVVYLTVGRTELRCWANMSTKWANTYREWILTHRSSVLARYVITDNYGLVVNRYYGRRFSLRLGGRNL
jgi:hypothetical protein